MSTHDMLNYLNRHATEDVQTRLILFIFTHYKALDQMNIVEMARRCYVSTASVSRVARRFGYQSFDQMKHSVASEMTISEPSFTYRMKRQSLNQLHTDPDAFFHKFADEISAAITDVAASLPYTEVDNMLKQIIASKQVTLFGFDIMVNALSTFQSAMLSLGIIVTLGVNHDTQLQQANNLEPGSLAIVFSSFGTFFAKQPDVYNAITQSKAHTILVTQMGGSSIYTNAFDETLNISSVSNAEAGSYPIDFLLDYMARRMFTLRH